MTGFISICAFTCICSSIILLVSKREKELSVLISSALYILVMIYGISVLSNFLSMLKDKINGYNSIPNLEILINVCGIGLISSIASSICESEGQKGLSLAIEFFATVDILKVGLPIVFELFSQAISLLGE